MATADEVGKTHESGGGAHCAVGDMTTVPHTPTSPGEERAERDRIHVWHRYGLLAVTLAVLVRGLLLRLTA